MLNAKDRHHEGCTALFRRFRGPIIVPAPMIAIARSGLLTCHFRH